ncbi:hypothetical protein Mp_7g02310 [Marchantia polymorpha subsp. ruderalis]|uniref:Uncharacterized protein n=2 Tax=Marchantia polymorpha TaxID=3197 RepID=A0AAF6BVC6_MARPO|nr:hypothetical protein MARPO_0088s0057 [Marchantia polymorpha]BBN15960.1 hypothetical protein Mp_7g02310 [Marchantia polymorpha subsp. ruderalis]|eukprot:PTQ33511.1 hypothetical protein MARPO_0088s0057 [Marchantia polymorpha]
MYTTHRDVEVFHQARRVWNTTNVQIPSAHFTSTPDLMERKSRNFCGRKISMEEISGLKMLLADCELERGNQSGEGVVAEEGRSDTLKPPTKGVNNTFVKDYKGSVQENKTENYEGSGEYTEPGSEDSPTGGCEGGNIQCTVSGKVRDSLAADEIEKDFVLADAGNGTQD